MLFHRLRKFFLAIIYIVCYIYCKNEVIEMWLDRLKRMKNESGLTTREISARSGVPEPTLEKLFAGVTKDPKLETMRQLVHFFGYTLGDLDDAPQTGRITSRLSKEAYDIAKRYDTLDDSVKGAVTAIIEYEEHRLAAKATKKSASTKIEYIRHYFIPAAAGYASPIEGSDYELIPRHDFVPRRADFCLDIQGDSMEPYIKDGQTVYVQRDVTPEAFDTGIFFIDGDVLCKQIFADCEGNIHLLSANPQRQDANRIIMSDATSTLVCFGKVLLPKKLPRPKYF